jgi:effector-binding domain-containing protein
MGKYFILTAFVILAGVIVFLLTRPCDFQARFAVNTTPDVVYFHLLNWHIWNRKEASSSIEITGRKPVKQVAHKVALVDTTLIFKWEINPLNDSLTMVRVCIWDPDRKGLNRLVAPLAETPFENSVRGNLSDMLRRLEIRLKTFQYAYMGGSHLNEISCVYIPLTSTQRGKARAMMAHVVTLNQFVRQNDLLLNGHPFVLVHHWNEFEDSIHFDFCFPIARTEAVPDHPEIRLKTVASMDAIKSEFYGNYSISDIAWYRLAEEANRLGYRRNGKLVEVFHNDPHAGGNELEWKAEIFLGIESIN